MSSGPAEQKEILSSLGVIRRRLFLARLTERVALGLAFGGAVAAVVAGARLLHERFPEWAAVLAVAPAAAGVWMFVKRRRVATANVPVKLVVMGAALAWAAAVVVVLLYAVAGFAGHVAVWELAAGAALAGVVAAGVTVKPVAARSAAIFVDQQVGLRERVSTALELLEGPVAASPMEAAFRGPVVNSAVAACGQVRTAKVGYWRLDRRVYPAAASAAIAAVVLSFLHPVPALAREKPKPYLQVVEKSNKLAEELKKIEEQEAKPNKDTESRLQPIKDAISQLKQGNVNPIDGDEKLEAIRAEMAKESEQMETSEKIAEQLRQMQAMDPLSEAEQQMKDATAQSGQDAGQAAAQQAAAEKAVDQAAGDVAKKVGAMNDTDKKATAEQLKNAAAKAGDDPKLQKDLNQAADAADKGNTQELQQSLADAGKEMGQQGGAQQLSGQALKDAMDAIDKANSGGMSQGEQQAMGNRGDSGNQEGNRGDSQNGSGDQDGQSGDSGQQQSAQGGNQGQQGNQGQGGNQGQDGSQSGQGGQAGGQQGGAQAGQGQTASSGGGDQQTSGDGSTPFHTPGGPGSKEQGNKVGKQGTFVKLYDSTVTKTDGAQEKLPANLNKNGAAAGSMEVKGQGDLSDPTIGTYESQLPGAKQRAMDDLQTQQIPPQYRDVVRGYYEK